MCCCEFATAPPAVRQATPVPVTSFRAAAAAMLSRTVTRALIDGSASASHARNCMRIGTDVGGGADALAGGPAAVVVLAERAVDKL